jgi:hypothetical protein
MDLIFSRRHKGLATKQNIWTLINKSYKGGDEYRMSGNLFRFIREGEKSYKDRIIRSVFENNTQPLADTLAGFPFIQPVKREVPKEFQYIIDSAYRGRPLDQFSRQMSVQSLLYTMFVLVDSPNYDPSQIKTLADRKAIGLNPYCIMYEPFKIRDFNISDNGVLNWILLDNSYCDNSDPMSEPKEITRYRLWKPNSYQDFEKNEKGEQILVNEQATNFGEIPGCFVLWKDIDDDLISDSPFEDIALMDRQNYNLASEQDELMFNAVFRVLFYPVQGSHGVPKDLIEGEISSLLAIPFDGSLSQKPYFDGPDISDVETIDRKIESNRRKQRAKIGIDEEMQKVFAQSGYAKSLDFMKTKSLITMGKNAIETMERNIVRFAGLWEGKSLKPEEINIEYDIDFDSAQAQEKFKQLLDTYDSLPYPKVKKALAKKIVREVFDDENAEDLKTMDSDIDAASETTTSTIGALMP